ncbi:helix-turn-helix domain-containing protein [Nonomuraea sp. SYSU D8015]|uniref:helix-turn-helix domain-containing protein n=1 Tax=Nonomuraea sp. SYSU D8015 TaxID=2593644 RepID=UPI001660238D|nr:helix-turn-helix transcriptional regulator [Nonomuraea sp. SYSU D8015]
METLGWWERLSAARAEKLLTQEQLASRIRDLAGPESALPKPPDLARMIRFWESGQNVPRPMYRTLLCRALDVSVLEVFGRRPRRKSAEADRPVSTPRPVVDEHLGDVLDHLSSQWHLLVQRDNLLGPRHTIPGVREQIGLVMELLAPARGEDRLRVLRLAARYAESAAWLYEDAGEFVEALRWTDQAASWAYEADDELMLAWTMFRRSQQAMADARAGEVIGLTEAALRRVDRLPTAMRAALVQQQAQGHALDGRETLCLSLLDEAQELAGQVNDDGDARAGHGAFVTPAYVDVTRAGCWSHLGKHARAVAAYEAALPKLAPVYQRDRGMALAGLAAAHAHSGQVEQAAERAQQALKIATTAGSSRIARVVAGVNKTLVPHRKKPEVAALRVALANAAGL